MSKYNIMTFDGGGIRGALTVRILKIIKDKKTDIFNKTNLFAGTSTGSLIALGLAAEIDIDTLDELYTERNGRYIFHPISSELISPRCSLRGLQDYYLILLT